MVSPWWRLTYSRLGFKFKGDEISDLVPLHRGADLEPDLRAVPPKYLPLMRLPFLSSSESAGVTVAPRKSAISNVQTTLGAIFSSP